MKLLSLKNFILIILFTSSFVTSQVDQPEETFGVKVGDTFTYVVSQKFGIDGPVFSDGFNDLYLDKGDNFNLTVVETTYVINPSIDVELWNHETSVIYSNDLSFFDFVSYIDWNYTESFLESFNLEFYKDDKTIHFTFFINSGENQASYFEYSYILETGILLHKFEYVAPLDDFQNPSKILQIDLGKIPLPRAVNNDIGVSVGEYYIYNMIQLQGFENHHVFQGKNNTLSLEAGNQFSITPLSSEPNTVNSIPLSFQTAENGILYDNKLDFQNSISNPSFFILTDWKFIENIIDSYAKANEDITIDYTTTSTNFIYKESYVSSENYYKLELRYDLSSGVLLYEALVFENLWNITFGIIEFELDDTNKIDQNKFSIDLDLSYNYKLIKYDTTSFEPFFESDKGNLWLFSGDTFSISPVSRPNNNDIIDLLIETGGDVIESSNRLDLIGSFFIYTDWEFWKNFYRLLDDLSRVEDSYTITTVNNEVIATQTTDTANLQILETMIYEESTGTLNHYLLEISGNDLSGKTIFTTIEFELESTTLQTIPGSDKISNGNDDFVQFLPFILLSGVIVLLVIQQRKPNNL